jgi:hypothetical protein
MKDYFIEKDFGLFTFLNDEDPKEEIWNFTK